MKQKDQVCNDHEILFFNLLKYFFFIDMTEEEKLIADLGKPKLGDRNIIRIRIRESKEFKV